MHASPLNVALIIGSTRENRFADTVASWLAARAESRSDIALEVLDLAEFRLPADFPNGPNAAVEAYTQRLVRADGFVVLTPEYNHSFPASLKQAIDVAYDEWKAKPVGFVSYGGISGGLRAVEQLRPIFAELHAVTVRDTVSFAGARSAFDPSGRPRQEERANASFDRLLTTLSWWGHTLRNAREAHPYPA